MKSTLLWHTLNHLDSREWTRIQQAADSSYFTSRPEVSQLLGILKSSIVDFKKLPSRETLYTTLFDGHAYNAAQLRLLISETLQIVEEVMALETLKKESHYKEMSLLSYYRQKGVQKNYKTHINRLNRTLENAQASIDQLDYEHLVEFERYQHEVEVHRTGQLNIQELLDTADKAYIARKLRLMCYARAHQQVIEREYHTDLSDTVIQLVEAHQLFEHPVIGAYYHAFVALTREDDEGNRSYLKLKDFLLNQFDRFDPRELRGLIVLAINYCILQHRRGETFYTRDIFLLYKTGIEEGPLIQNDSITPYTYRNIVAAGIILNELEWAEEFIQKYRSYLDKDQRESVYSFNMARVRYHLGDYESVREYLWNTDFEDTLLSLSAKTILLKVYFIIGEYLLLDSAIESFRAYLLRKKIARTHASNYHKIMTYMKYLRRVASFQKKPDSIAKLKNKLKNETSFTEKNWFLEQIDMIEA